MFDVGERFDAPSSLEPVAITTPSPSPLALSYFIISFVKIGVPSEFFLFVLVSFVFIKRSLAPCPEPILTLLIPLVFCCALSCGFLSI